MRRSWMGLCLLGLICIAVLAGCSSPKPKPTAQPVKIGAVLALTGRGATYGKRAQKGMLLAVDEVNKRAFFKDHPLILVSEDSQSEATGALSAFRKLIDTDRVPVAVGFVLSDEVLASAPTANEREVVLFSTAAGSDKIKDSGDYVFRNRESATLQADAVASACVKRYGLKRVAVLHSNSANGVSYERSFLSAAKSRGAAIVADVGYDEGKTDYRAEIQQVKAAHPEGVYLAGLDQELGLVLKQSRELAFNSRFFASAGAVSQKLLDIAGSGSEGMVCGSAPFDQASPDKHVKAFVAAFQSRFHEDPDFIAANSYDAVALLADAFERGARSGQDLKSALYKVKDYPGVGGQTTFDGFGEVSKPIILVEVHGGRFTPLPRD